jgi:hypothetical protein
MMKANMMADRAAHVNRQARKGWKACDVYAIARRGTGGPGGLVEGGGQKIIPPTRVERHCATLVCTICIIYMSAREMNCRSGYRHPVPKLERVSANTSRWNRPAEC